MSNGQLISLKPLQVVIYYMLSELNCHKGQNFPYTLSTSYLCIFMIRKAKRTIDCIGGSFKNPLQAFKHLLFKHLLFII